MTEVTLPCVRPQADVLPSLSFAPEDASIQQLPQSQAPHLDHQSMCQCLCLFFCKKICDWQDNLYLVIEIPCLAWERGGDLEDQESCFLPNKYGALNIYSPALYDFM